jgi:hypothetical protein
LRYMEDTRKTLFEHSDKILGKLQLLSVYFEDELVIRIYIRSQVIHKLFESNPELDINKLDLFHIQFTESIIALLKKIKQNNEKTVSSIQDELQLNTELVAKISSTMRSEENFELGQAKQTQKINQSLSGLYQNLSGYSAEIPIAKNISEFSARYARDFFQEIPEALFRELTEFEPDMVYRNGYAIIEKKLLGSQCRNDFKNLFVCGLKAGGQMLEVYKILQRNEYFIFMQSRNLFQHCSKEQLDRVGLIDMRSRKARLIQELKDKNSTLAAQAEAAKTNIPSAVRDLLKEYHTKISGIDFLDLIDDYDVQANILKTMLNTDLM